jgi:ribosome-associated protein
VLGCVGSGPFPSPLLTPRGSLRTRSTAPKDTTLSSSRSPRSRKQPDAQQDPAPASKGAADSANLAALAAQQLEDDKAENILSIPLAGKSPMADMMIVASGRSQRHVAALADHVSRKFKEAGAPRVRVEGLPNADWVLIDAGDVIVHIFRPEVREFYNLERIWSSDAPAGHVRSAS